MGKKQKLKIFLSATSATLTLTLIYLGVVTAISGWTFAQDQFASYWYFLASLAIGFGIQVGLYVYLRLLVKKTGTSIGGKTVIATGTTSTLAMVSCCAHYLANILPLLGVVGVLSVIAQYQVEFFWVGLIFNLFGIAFISNKVRIFKRQLLV